MTIKYEKENALLIKIESTLEEDEDTEELERIAHNLRDDLNELDVVEKVELVKNEGDKREPPKGSKAGGDMVTLGSMLVTLGASAASTIIPNLANTLQSWVTRNETHKISLEIGGDKLELTGVSDKEQQRLIDTWISHHMEKRI
jgi:hypothetical protein